MSSEHVLWVLVGCLALGLLLDALIPLRRLQQPRRLRWTGNAGLYVVGMLLGQLVVPGGSLAAALWAQQQGVGLLNQLAVPGWVGLLAGVVILDLAAYWLHRLAHSWPWYWRLHRIHHTDLDVDVTTGFRHHPLDLVLTFAVLSLLVVVLGISVQAALLRLLISIPVTLFGHSNWLLPPRLDRVLRWLIVTPAMHRVHHSAWRRETDSNYGAVLSVWDRLFGTYTWAPRAGYRDMQLGLERYRGRADQGLRALLLNPFERAR